MRSNAVRNLVACAVLFGAVGLVWSQTTPTVKLMSASGVSYLTDPAGMTLYYYTPDTTGQSTCFGTCLERWPLFYAPTVLVTPPLVASDFGTITRTDGKMQTTYKGWPLYYWFQDKAAGEMKGEGVGKVWYILKVPSYTVMVGTNKAVGNYLVDANGTALYYYTKDTVGQSACVGDCIKNWPAFNAAGFVVPSALNAADFAFITRADGTRQVTYKGWPLYYWVRDVARGDVTGQDVGKVWYVVDPAKFPPM